MILTCPKCASRFVLPDHLLADGGRRVKCSSCGEVWFQEPEDQREETEDQQAQEQPEKPAEKAPVEITDDTIVEDMPEQEQDDDIAEEFTEEDIAEEATDETEAEEDEGPAGFAAVLAEAEGREPEISAETTGEIDTAETGVTAEAAQEQEKPQGSGKRKILGFALAGGVFAVTLALFIALHGPISHVWPASQSVYRWLGYDITVPGSRLIFDGIRVGMTETETGAHVVNVKGRVMNLSREDQSVPMIEAALRRETGEVVAQWYITPPADHLAAESEMEFESSHETAETGAEVKVRFVLEAAPKNASEDAGNIPAHD